jgi:hypothetical protein
LPAAADPRFLLDEPVDLLISDDLTLDEARGWPDFVPTLLPWTKTYVLASTSSLHLADMQPSFSASGREALARDVLRCVARAATPPAWWSESERCGLAYSPGTLQEAVPHVIFDSRDAQARALAERVVALSNDPLRAVALAPRSFASALHDGSALFYVLALPSRVGSPCSQTQILAQQAPWMLRGWSSPPRSTWRIRDLSLEKHMLPLAETRPILMTRRGLVGIHIEADGTLDLDRIGWSRSGESP